MFVKNDAELVDEADDRLPAAPADPTALAALATELGIESSLQRLGAALSWPSP